MIVWRGWGILALIIPVVVWMVVPEVFKAMLPESTYSASYAGISTGSVLLGAAALWFLGRRLNGREGRTMVDEQTGERITLRASHSLFFVNMEWWAIPLALFALVMLFA